MLVVTVAQGTTKKGKERGHQFQKMPIDRRFTELNIVDQRKEKEKRRKKKQDDSCEFQRAIVRGKIDLRAKRLGPNRKLSKGLMHLGNEAADKFKNLDKESYVKKTYKVTRKMHYDDE